MSFDDWFIPGPTDPRPRPGTKEFGYKIGDIGVGSLVVAIERGRSFQGQLDHDKITPKVLYVTNVYPDKGQVCVTFHKANYTIQLASWLRLATADEIRVDAERREASEIEMYKELGLKRPTNDKTK